MKTPEMQVADYLTNDERLVAMMDELRQDKLSYVPIFTSTPDDPFNKASIVTIHRIIPRYRGDPNPRC